MLQMPPPDPGPIPPPISAKASELTRPRPIRRGSLSERFVTCSKPSCACRRDKNARHGPYLSLTRAVGGRTHSRLLTAEQAIIAKQQIEEGRQFRHALEEYWTVCEQWADAQLENLHEASKDEAEKGGSARRSPRKSSRKSKHS